MKRQLKQIKKSNAKSENEIDFFNKQSEINNVKEKLNSNFENNISDKILQHSKTTASKCCKKYEKKTSCLNINQHLKNVLLLGNLKELNIAFKTKFPTEKNGFSKFCNLNLNGVLHHGHLGPI